MASSSKVRKVLMSMATVAVGAVVRCFTLAWASMHLFRSRLLAAMHAPAEPSMLIS
ncbi:hypothetical protein M4R21_18130 [Acidovorax sp. GBBC 3297]|nr:MULTISPECIES: hypothetical protein [unclassified Acidovorax]MDA8451663.1 hypothetical protein [Acidovorax sp. GBBC 3297]MDA8461109.1 hypothetical protein [Acidovorax sp. GBBC 3333]